MPSSCAVRELIFALLWVVSAKSRFISLPPGSCHNRTCGSSVDGWGPCRLADTSRPSGGGRLDQDENGQHDFGSNTINVSPAATTYWFDDVLVSLAQRVDGAAVTAAVGWGLSQGRRSFQLVVISLFEVIAAEVSETGPGGSKGPFVTVSQPLHLSPLREKDCLDNHPRERPPLPKGKNRIRPEHDKMEHATRHTFRSLFPGLGLLVNFFDAALRRRAATKTTGVFPTEIYWRIMDHVDYDTWQACRAVSETFYVHSVEKFRIDDRWELLAKAGPAPWPPSSRLTFRAQDMYDEPICVSLSEADQYVTCREMSAFNWMPTVGIAPRVRMAHVYVEFEPSMYALNLN